MLKHYRPKAAPPGAGGDRCKYLKEGHSRAEQTREYYLGANPETNGMLWGKGAERLVDEFGLNLDLPPSDDVLVGLLEGRTPDGKQAVRLWGGMHAPGSDFVFSPPKSVSVEMIYASPERRAEIEAALLRNVKRALAVLQDEAKCATVYENGQKVMVTADLIAGLFTHYTSRPTLETVENGRPPDVGIHVHAFVMNMAHRAGKWVSIDHRRLMHKSRQARYVFEQGMAHDMEQMGYPVEYMDEDRRANRTWELDGTDPRIRDLFSSRHREVESTIRAFEKKEGRPPTWIEQQEMVRAGRRGKHEEEKEPCWADYVAAVEKAGLTYESPCRDEPIERKGSLANRRGLAREALLASNGLCGDDAGFHRYKVPATAWVSAMGYLTPDETEAWVAELLASDELVPVTRADRDPDYDLLTTRSNLRREMESTATAICMGYEQGPAPSKRAQDDAVRSFAWKRDMPDAEQIAAVRHLCGPQRWAHMVGWAGSGKTTVASIAMDAWKAEKLIDRVITVAVAGSTAQRVGESIGSDWCGSVEQLAAAIDVEEMDPPTPKVGEKIGPRHFRKRYRRTPMEINERTLVILDEAVMADTERLAMFVKLCRNAVVRCIGDPLQLEAIGAGGGFRAIDDALGHAELRYVHRQRHDEDRWALSDIRHGKSGAALRSLEERGRLHLSENHEHAVGELVAFYALKRRQGYKASDIIVNTDAPNTEIDGLNRLIQNLRMEWGELGRESITIEATKDKRFESFHRGDMVAFTEGYKDEEHGVWARNGTQGVVTRVAPWGMVVRTDKGIDVSVYIKPRESTQPVRLAYAGHATRTQGGEAEIALVLPWQATTDRGSAYSMTTRAREEVHVFCGFAKEKLAEKWKVFTPKKSAEDVMAEQDYEPWPETAQEYVRRRGLERV